MMVMDDAVKIDRKHLEALVDFYEIHSDEHAQQDRYEQACAVARALLSESDPSKKTPSGTEPDGV